MDPTTQSHQPAFAPGYVPYFYESGRFLTYATPSDPHASQSFSAHPRRTSSLPPPYASRNPDGLQTVEQIIRHGYLSVPQADPTTAILSDKQHTSWLGLDDLIHQSQGRVQIYQQNVYELEQAKCEARNALFRMEAQQGHPASDRQHYVVDKRLQELYEQQRSERVTLWRDVSRIRLGIPETAQQYLSAHRTIAALDTHSGDDE